MDHDNQPPFTCTVCHTPHALYELIADRCHACTAAELERVNKACAEMREVLRRVQWDFDILVRVRGDLEGEPRAHRTLEIVEAVLSSKAGTGYVRKEDVKPLVEALTQIQHAFIRLNNGCYPLPYPPADEWKRQACDKVGRAIEHARTKGLS